MTQEPAATPPRSFAAPLVIALCALVAVGLVIGGVLFIRSQLGEGGEPLGTVVAEIVVEVDDADGTALEPSDLEIARQIAITRLDRAGIHPVAVSATGTGLLVQLGEGVDAANVDRAGEILNWPATIEFREVLDVSFEVGPGDCAAQDGLRPEDTVTLCDRERSAIYVLGPSELDGSGISSVAATEQIPGSDPSAESWAVTITFTGDGAGELEQLTARLAQNQGQAAVVVAREVITAPRVMAAITGPELQISGTFDRAHAEALAREIDLARHGLTFAVLSVEVFD